MNQVGIWSNQDHLAATHRNLNSFGAEVFSFFVILLYIFMPSLVQLFLLLFIAVITFLRPYLGVVLSLCTPLLDERLVIPFADRSIVYLIYFVGFLQMIISGRTFRTSKKVAFSLISLTLSLSISILLGHERVIYRSGFGDPSRGLIFILGLTYFVLCIGFYGQDIIIQIRRSLWMLTAFFLASSIIGILLEGGFRLDGRFAGTMVDPNYFARMGLISISLLMFSGLKSRLKLIIMLLVLLLVVSTFSRTAIIALVIVFAVWILSSKAKHGVVLLLASVVILFLLLPFVNDVITTVILRFDPSQVFIMRGTRMNNPIDVLTAGRTFLWKSAAQVFFSDYKNLLFGTGIGTGIELVRQGFGYPIVLHNGFLDLFFEAGVIGVMALVFFLLSVFSWLDKSIGISRQRQFSLILMLFFVFNITLSGFWTKQNLLILSLLILSSGTKDDSREIES